MIRRGFPSSAALVAWAVVLCQGLAVLAEVATEEDVYHYGVDVSFPVHHATVSTNYPSLPHNSRTGVVPPIQYEEMPLQTLGNKEKFYNEFMEGCRNHYGSRAHMCDATERDRIKMSLDQPQAMKNYTDTGFKKIRAPDELYRLLKDHWDRNRDRKVQEKWTVGNTYVNHWESPTYMTSVEETNMRGGGRHLKQRIWDAARPVLEEWTGQELKEASLYGVREYTTGAVLSPHVDRNPLISSCIVNVAQDVDEDWPLEVIGRDGRAYNVTMQPGDMVLYESHSLLHARPFPLKGRFYANTFIHFEPVVKDGSDADLPTYILDGTTWAEKWRRNNPGGHHSPSVTTRQTEAHGAARMGDMDTLMSIAEEDATHLHKPDENGWQPLHEAVRAGHAEVVHFLVQQGSDINARTNGGRGGTPLWWAKTSHDGIHPVTQLLQELGGIEIGPEL